MPILAAGIVIGIALCMLYRNRAGSPGVRLFDSGETYIVVDGSAVRLRRGFVPERTLTALADTLRQAGVSSGHITLTQDNRVAISWHIPPALHQTIRNILLLERSAGAAGAGCGATRSH
jgi:hypothetical protein